MAMFEEMPWPGRKRWNRSMVVSLAIHLALLLALLHASRPLFLTPHEVALGIPDPQGRSLLFIWRRWRAGKPGPYPRNRG